VTVLADDLMHLATGRRTSLFQDAVDDRAEELRNKFSGASVLVAGAAGSIGTATVRQILDLEPRSVVLLDQSENGLAELIREIRATNRVRRQTHLQTVLGDITSPLLSRLSGLVGPFDMVMNLAAVKHVRSERDVLSALRLLQVNVLGTHNLMSMMSSSKEFSRFFSVSTDKAAGPVSLMGASKRLMEQVMFEGSFGCEVSSCRFANVAFSAGSLPESWLRRITLCQPVAVPRGIRRYFVSGEEAGQFCVLAAAGDTGSIFVPALDPEEQLISLEELLRAVLDHLGLSPEFYVDEAEAIADCSRLRREERQPVVVTEPDTSGEKPIEEFVAAGEESERTTMPNILRISANTHPALHLSDTLETIRMLTTAVGPLPAIDEIVELVEAAVPTYEPMRSERSLDERL
jgi:FlaA1/EpsC-like NDP-sugar epimerase